mgnify:CR=1 FL=1
MTLVKHHPVLLNAVLATINPRANSIYVDGTFGGGGYSKAFLQAANCQVWGIDQDPLACERGLKISKNFKSRLKVIHGKFADMGRLLDEQNIRAVDGIALDLGVSSFQLDDPERGFSFKKDGPLDMRMSSDGPTAADIVNEADEDELSNIIFQYGEERFSRRIASSIVKARNTEPITRTIQLANIIRSCQPKARKVRSLIDPATRTFQALRVFINDELNELRNGLIAAESLLNTGGRLVVVSFHSLEDRIVKTFFRDRTGGQPQTSRHLPEKRKGDFSPTFCEFDRRPTVPNLKEVGNNPRASSARMRGAERTAFPPWPQEKFKRKAKKFL